MGRRESIEVRFERKFDPEPMSGCWLWTGGVNPEGYGHIYRFGTMQGAHRVAYKLYVGPIPEGLSVLHRCDLPSCVNPRHLFVGTQRENMADMRAKGRGHKQFLCDRSKLRHFHIPIIKAMLADGMTQTACAKHFGVSQSQIFRVAHGRHVLVRSGQGISRQQTGT